MKLCFKSVLMSCLVLTLVMGLFTTSFAGEVITSNETINNNFEIEIQKQNLKDNSEIIVIQENDGTLRAINNSDAMSRGTAVYCTVKVAYWSSSYVYINVSATASGPIKKVTGTLKVSSSGWFGSDLDTIYVNLSNSAGSTTLNDQYSAWVGSEDSIKLKFYNVYATDLYGQTGSLISWNSGTINRP